MGFSVEEIMYNVASSCSQDSNPGDHIYTDVEVR